MNLTVRLIARLIARLGGFTILAVVATPGSVPAQQIFTVEAAVEAALAQHPSAAIARARVAEAEAELRGARAGRLPWVAVQGEIMRYELPMVVAPLHAFDPQNAPEFDETLMRSRAGLSWLVFDGGARGASIDGGRAARDGRVAREEDARADLIERTVTAYLQVVASRRSVEASEERGAALEAELDRVERFLAEGRAAEVERLRAEAGLREAEAELASARAGLRVQHGVLARLTGLTPGQVAGLDLTLLSLRREGPPVPQVGEPASPITLAARERVRAAEARLDGVRGARLPRLEAVAGWTQFGGAASSTTVEWDAGLRFSWPMFTGGEQGAAEQAARARLREAREDLRLIELHVEQEVDRARAALDEALVRRDALQAAVRSLEEVVRIEALSLETGAGVQSDLLSAHASLAEARAGLADARAAVIIWRVRLARALGALSPSWLLETVEAETMEEVR